MGLSQVLAQVMQGDPLDHVGVGFCLESSSMLLFGHT